MQTSDFLVGGYQMTLSKLAKLANVSVSVVSKAFSGRDDVSEAMREHVFAVAKEHGCFHQFYHVPYDKPVVALIIPEIISQYYVSYLESLKKRLEEDGYTLLLSISNFDAQMEEELIRYYTEHTKVNALITFSNHYVIPKNSKTAFISFAFRQDNALGCHIYRNSDSAFREALTHLKTLGHRRIAFIGEPFTTVQQRDFVRFSKEMGFDAPDEYIVCSKYRFERAGADGIEKLWSLTEKPTAVFGAYGYITKGILSRLNELSVSVPDGVSVISLNSEPSPLDPNVSVSLIPSAIDEICKKAVTVLNERIACDEPNAPCDFEIPVPFTVGDTIKKPFA